MRKLYLVLLVTACCASLFGVTDTQTMQVSAFYNSSTTTKYVSLDIMDKNGVSLANGGTVSILSDSIGDYAKVFQWSFLGNLYSQTTGSWWSSTTYSTMKLSFEFGPLTDTTDNSKTIPMTVSLIPNTTFVGSSSLGDDGAVITITKNGTTSSATYKDTISWDSTSASVSDSSVTFTGTYAMEVTGTELGLQWQRTGEGYVKLASTDVSSATSGTYRSKVTVTIKMT